MNPAVWALSALLAALGSAQQPQQVDQFGPAGRFGPGQAGPLFLRCECQDRGGSRFGCNLWRCQDLSNLGGRR